MKGLILSGGKGSRLRPLTHTRAKQLIPIANKPILLYAVEDLVNAGITTIGVIVNPETADEVRHALGAGVAQAAHFTFIPQASPLGLAHAVKTARQFLGDEAFVVYLGDNLLSGGIAHVVEEHRAGDYDAGILLTPVDNPSEFGVAVLDQDGRVVRLTEKPPDPISNLALVGVYLFSPFVHEVIDTLTPSWRGEYEITEAIQGLIDRGRPVKAHRVRGWWKDTGRPEDLLDANRLILSQCTRRIAGTVVDSEIVGNVVVEEEARIEASLIRGPAHIGAGAFVDHGYVGPYTSIGRHGRVILSEVEYSIILDHAEVRHLPYRLDGSIVGENALVDGKGNGPRKNAMQLILGDRSQVKL